MDWYGKEVDDLKLHRIRELIDLSYVKERVMKKRLDVFNLFQDELKNEISSLYEEFGLKTMVKLIGCDMTYTRIRRILRDLHIDLKQRTVTDDLRRIRSINAYAKKNFVDWTTKSFQRKERGVQGIYVTRHGDEVWLRSSWEYAYAKYLDSILANWKFEKESYLLSTGERYRPDFFIYDQEDHLIEIVEVKSLYFETAKKRLEKAKLASKEFDFSLKIIDENDLNQIYNMKSLLREWKKVRRLHKDENNAAIH
jgi:hypothetical protein